MRLTVGEISKALGISTETIRFYVEEGLISPKKNEKNNYWEYSSDDLIKLTDIMFYRSNDINIRDIKKIMKGATLDEIQEIIDQRKTELIKSISQSMKSLESINNWQNRLKEEREMLDNFVVGDMPTGFKRPGYFEETTHLAEYIKNWFMIDKEDWGNISISFYYDKNESHPKVRRYLSIENLMKVNPLNITHHHIEEKASNCLITVIKYDDDIEKMLKPMIDYANEKNLKLTGEFYGKENTNFFEKGKRSGLYCVYAPLK